MDIRILLTFFVALLTQPFFVYSAPHMCPSTCKCQSIYKMLCRNITLTDVPAEVPKSTITLDLSHNAISHLTVASFSNKEMSQLTSLYIYNNDIRSIDAEAFKSLTNLKSLFMGMNKLTYIHQHTFAHNTRLEELDLHGNNISLGDEGPFHNLVNLCVLNLADCNLNNIPKRAFEKTVNLSKLDMSNNKLTYIDDHLFDNLKSLKVLNLSANLLISVGFLLVMPIKSLCEINLFIRNNKLDNVSDDVLKRMGYLKNLYIHQNPFLCRCWDINCSKFIKGWETYVEHCLNKTTSLSTTETAITADIRPTKTSVSEETHVEMPGIKITTISVGTTGVTGGEIDQESSQTPLGKSAVAISMYVLAVVILLIIVIVICVIRQNKSSVSTEYDSVQHEGNSEQKFKCEDCRIYQNHTPNCNHKIWRQNVSRQRKDEVNFATQSKLETYETVSAEETEEGVLYALGNEEIWKKYVASNSDSCNSSLIQSPGPRVEAMRKCSPITDIMSMENTSTSERAKRILTFPRHARKENSRNLHTHYTSLPLEYGDV